MKRGLSVVLVAVCLLGGLTPACRRAELSGPPELRLGRAECGECGMLISEDRCSAAVLIERDGERMHLSFDDIGCLLEYEAQKTGDVIIERYVHDYASRGWVKAGDAIFLVGDKYALRTPMTSGIVAFSERGNAEEQRGRTGGEFMSYEQLVARAAE